MYYDRPRKKDRRDEGSVRAKARPQRAQSAKRGNAGKPQRVIAPPRKKRHIALKAALALLLLVVLALGALYFIPVSTFGAQSAPGASVQLPGGYTHVLLIGIDTNADKTSRSDTMMILSVGKGRALLTSLQRDTGVTIEGRSGLHRLNAAYSYGGPELLLRTINQNFGMDLSLYMLVDYDSFPELIDLLGGVYVEGIKDKEIEYLNHNMRDVLRRRYEDGRMTREEIYLLYLKEELTKGGDLHLDGLQALGYARIRKTDSDYQRTERQRRIISAALRSLKSAGPVTAVRFASKAIQCVETNMNFVQLLSLGEKALLTTRIEQMQLPATGTFTDEGSMFYNVDYAKNHDLFIEFVYGS